MGNAAAGSHSFGFITTGEYCDDGNTSIFNGNSAHSSTNGILITGTDRNCTYLTNFKTWKNTNVAVMPFLKSSLISSYLQVADSQ